MDSITPPKKQIPVTPAAATPPTTPAPTPDPAPAPIDPTASTIMPDPEPAEEPGSILANEPEEDSVPEAPAETTVPVTATPSSAPQAATDPEPEVGVAPITDAKPADTPAPTESAAPAANPLETDGDSLFEPVEEEPETPEAPAEEAPTAEAPVAATPPQPVAPASVHRMDDANSGSTVVKASTKPHKSKTKMFALIILGLIIFGGIGYAAYNYFYKPNVAKSNLPTEATAVSVTTLTPSGLKQSTDTADLGAAAQTNTTTLVLTSETPSNAPSNLALQVEVQPLGTDFTGTPLASTVAVADPSNALKLTLTNYPEGSYHWRARFTDGSNNGAWVAFNKGTDAGKTADFTIDRKAPAAAVLKTVNGRTVTSKTITSTKAMPVFTGTAEAGVTVTLQLSESISYKATADANGAWSITATAAVPNGKYAVNLIAADLAGNAASPYAFSLTQAAK